MDTHWDIGKMAYIGKREVDGFDYGIVMKCLCCCVSWMKIKPKRLSNNYTYWSI